MWIWLCFFQKPKRRGNEEIELVFVEMYVREESLKRKMARSWVRSALWNVLRDM